VLGLVVLFPLFGGPFAGVEGLEAPLLSAGDAVPGPILFGVDGGTEFGVAFGVVVVLSVLVMRCEYVPPPMSAGSTRFGGATFCAAAPAARAAL
jgi:hypothetical protein